MPPGTAFWITSSELAIVFLLPGYGCDFLFAKSGAAGRQRIVDHKHDDRAHNCDNHAPNVQTRDASPAKKLEQKATDDSTNNSQRDVEPETLALSIDNFASNEPGDQAKYNPADDGHGPPPFELTRKLSANIFAPHSVQLGFPLNGYRDIPHQLSGRSPISMHVHRTQCV